MTLREYASRLTESVGAGWTGFWFTGSDPAVLGLIRIVAGGLALYSQATMTPDLVTFFGPEGLLPVETVREWQGESWSLSYLNLVRDTGGLWFLHVAGLVVLALFTVGFLTRVTSVLACMVVLAGIHRGPMLTSEFEPILSMIMVYLAVGPSGAFWSVDSWRASRARAKTPGGSRSDLPRSWLATVATRLLQVHTSVACLMMAVAKLSPGAPGIEQPWWTGEAVWWMAARNGTGWANLPALLDGAPILVNLLTYGILGFEILFALLVWNGLLRPALVVLAMPLWLGIGILTGNFPYSLSMMAASLAFVSPGWLRLAAGSGTRKAGLRTAVG